MKPIALFTSLAMASLAAASAAPNCPPKAVTPAEQRAIFDTFVDLFYRKKNIVDAFKNHVALDYIQHNPNFLSGRQVASDGLSKFVPMVNTTLAKVGLSDNVGWVFAKQEMAGRPYNAVVDIFRLDGSCVMEHWDVIQSHAPGAKNPLALFDGQDFTKKPI
jgi:predicted SnoaL-like aldol condensation-catalyzing enzyme